MAQTKVKLISDGVIVQGNLHASHGITTAHIGEGSNLYYTDARVGSYLSTNSFATESYVGTQIANLVDSSPSALNTLNELAAALGDDANFSTTVTNSIALKAPLASPSFTGNATFAGNVGIGAAASDGNLHVRKTGINTGITNVLMNANFADGSNGTGLSIGYRTDETTAVLAARTATGNIAFYSYDGGWSESMRIKNTGNVGIGTDTPSALLEIQTAGTTGNQDFQIFSRGESPNYEVFKISRAAGSTELLANQNLTLSADYDANHTSVDSNIIFKTDNVEKMRITPGGSLEVGTATVAAANAAADNIVIKGEGTAVGLTISNSSNAGTGTIFFGDAASSAAAGFRYNHNTGDMAISAEDNINFACDNIGIGTTSPSRKLDVRDSSNTQSTLLAYNQGASFTGTVYEAITDRTASSDFNLMNLKSSTNSKFLVRGDGNVGIGTASPDTLLHISKNSSNSQLTLERTGSSTGKFKIYTNTNSLFIYDEGQTSHRMMINSSGNVGIGTTSPSAKLHVNGVITANDSIQVQNDDSGFICRNAAGTVIGTVGAESSSTPNIGMFTVRDNGNNRIVLNSNGNSYFNGGNVGIGTTSPAQALQIVQGESMLVGNSFFLGSGDSNYLGAIGFNRDTTNGNIFNSSYGAYQIHNYQGTLKLQVYSAAGSTIGEHKFFNNGDVAFFNNTGIGLTSSPQAKLDARGAIMTGSAAEDGNFSSTTATGMSVCESGSLQINQGWVGSGTNGDTIVFRYNATAWKSWGLEWNIMSTNGMSSGFIGGYNNNSTGHSNVTSNNAHGITVSFSKSFQNNIITFTSTTGFGTHPMASFKYYQSGGDGRPYPSKASITMNS